MKLISACLLGINCKYNSKNNKGKINSEAIGKLLRDGLIPVCPEQLGGLPTPRERAQIQNGDGGRVLSGSAKVLTENSRDISSEFLKGAKEALKIVQIFNIKEAILKQRSPSCGCGQIHDGTFSGNVVKGDGVTAALLKQNGIEIKTEEDFI